MMTEYLEYDSWKTGQQWEGWISSDKGQKIKSQSIRQQSLTGSGVQVPPTMLDSESENQQHQELEC